jgi:hypothetical protein
MLRSVPARRGRDRAQEGDHAQPCCPSAGRCGDPASPVSRAPGTRPPAARPRLGKLPYLKLLEERAFIARVSVGRIVRNADSDELDYISEGDHILSQLAELPPSTYRHHRAGH